MVKSISKISTTEKKTTTLKLIAELCFDTFTKPQISLIDQ